VKGRTAARVASVKSIVHLDSTSALHAEHQELSKRIHAQASREVTVSVEPPTILNFPSIGKGIMLDQKGVEIGSEKHLKRLDQLRQDRSFYIAKETRKNGATYERKLRTTGVHQLAVPYFPVYSMTFARLDNQGIPVRDAVLDHTRKLGTEFERLTGYEVLASQIHPNEGVLHPHICYATVDHEHRLLHSITGRGRRGLRFLGPALIGTLRLVENGIWPESDSEMATTFLKGSIRRGQEPVDWVLSRYLDGLAEKTLLNLSRTHEIVKQIWGEVVHEYSAYAIKRRSERPDLMANRLSELESENNDLRAELIALRLQSEPEASALLGKDVLGLPLLDVGPLPRNDSYMSPRAGRPNLLEPGF
jgi:hypothetical protein